MTKSQQALPLALTLAAVSLAFVLAAPVSRSASLDETLAVPAEAGVLATMPGHQMALPGPAVAGASLPLKFSGAVVVAVPPGITETSVFLTLRNTGAKAIVLSGVSSPLAASGMLMDTRRDAQGRSGMVMVPTLTVPAGATLTLNESGKHLMLMGLRRPLKVGETLPLELSAADGRVLKLGAVVRKP